MCPRIYLCPFEDCEQTFTDVTLLENHQNTHTIKPKRVFTCNQPNCEKTYAYKCHLKRHIETNHSESKNETSTTFPCKLCAKILKTNDILQKHLKTIHSNDKLKCSHCGKQFNKLQHLKTHEYDHTGIKPFTCPVDGCGKTFLVPSRLKNHEKTHKGYACDVENCDSTFTTWSLLSKHKTKFHPKRFECKICSRSFLRKNNLKSHSATHSNERECFNCPYDNCPRYYYFVKNLEQHIRNFHENKKISCPNPICAQKFCNKFKLDNHLRLKICAAKKVKRTRKKRKPSLASKLSGVGSDDGAGAASGSDVEGTGKLGSGTSVVIPVERSVA